MSNETKYPAVPKKTVVQRYTTGSRKAGNWSHVVHYDDGTISVWFIDKTPKKESDNE